MPTNDTQQSRRRDAYRRVCEHYSVDLTANYSGAEDAAAYLSGASGPLDRYVVVTETGEFRYASPSAATLGDAKHDATEHASDSLWPEGPVAIVDLDTGATWRPAWTLLPWVSTAPMPEQARHRVLMPALLSQLKDAATNAARSA